jgi:cytochrome b
MNTTSASPADSGAQAQPSRRIIDAPTRAFHWLMALSFLGAYLTADGERWRLVHVTLGYTVIGLIVFRLLWGLLGPRSVRLSAWAGKLRGLPAFVQSLQGGRINWQAGQNLLQTLAIVALLGLALLTTASGYILYEDLTGEWMEEVHEVLGNAALAIVGLHLVLVLAASVLRRQNLALTMLTGRTPGRGPDLVKNNRAPLAALLLACVLAGWAWQWQNAPTGADLADSPAAAAQSRGHDSDDD